MEKILGGIILSTMVVLSLHAACSSAGSIPTNLNPLEITETSMLEIVRQPREIISILQMIKEQFKLIIQSIFSEMWGIIRSFVSQLRENILRKFQVFTVSDVLRAIFDGLTETAMELEPQLYVEAVEPVAIEEVEVYGNPYYSSLATLLRQ